MVDIFVLISITTVIRESYPSNKMLCLFAGQIMETLDRFNLRDHTLVYLTSDQGGHVEEISATGVVQGGWNGVYKGVVP